MSRAISTIFILDRGRLAQRVLGPDIAALECQTAVSIQRHEGVRAHDVGRIIDQGPLLECHYGVDSGRGKDRITRSCRPGLSSILSPMPIFVEDGGKK